MTRGRSEISAALSQIPDHLREPLLDDYVGMLEAYRLSHWETVGIKTGKVCEHIYTILDGLGSGSYASAPQKPQNMVASCMALEQLDAQKFSRSIRIQIPRIIIAAYELRNNRAIGHVSGDLSPNRMDAEFLSRAVRWLISELVRIYNSASTDVAQSLVDAYFREDITSNMVKRQCNKGSQTQYAYEGQGPCHYVYDFRAYFG